MHSKNSRNLRHDRLLVSVPLDVSVPHGRQVAPQPGHEDGGEESVGDEVEEGGLGRVHEEEGYEGGHQTKDVT